MGLFGKGDRIVHFHSAWHRGMGATFRARLRPDGTGTIEASYPDDGPRTQVDSAYQEVAFNELAAALGMPASKPVDTTNMTARVSWDPPLPRRRSFATSINQVLEAHYAKVRALFEGDEVAENGGVALWIEEGSSGRKRGEGSLVLTNTRLIFADDQRGPMMWVARQDVIQAQSKRIIVPAMRELHLQMNTGGGHRVHTSFYVGTHFAGQLERALRN